jgi:SAM-dependent methyltransferase
MRNWFTARGRREMSVGASMDEYAYSADYDDPLLAELYDQAITESDDVEMIRRLIAGMGPLNILECFCGTGRILAPLACDGHAVTGIELAAGMLARARAKLERPGADVRDRATLRVADVLAGGWGGGYDLVIIGANAFYELPSPEQQARCIGHAAAALKPGGWLFVDNDDYKCDWGAGPFGSARVVFEGTGSDGTFGRFTMKNVSFDADRDVLAMERIWTKRRPDGAEVVRRYLGHKHPVSAAEVRGWLGQYGFEVLNVYGDRSGAPYTSSSRRAIFWAMKR